MSIYLLPGLIRDRIRIPIPPARSPGPGLVPQNLYPLYPFPGLLLGGERFLHPPVHRVPVLLLSFYRIIGQACVFHLPAPFLLVDCFWPLPRSTREPLPSLPATGRDKGRGHLFPAGTVSIPPGDSRIAPTVTVQYSVFPRSDLQNVRSSGPPAQAPFFLALVSLAFLAGVIEPLGLAFAVFVEMHPSGPWSWNSWPAPLSSPDTPACSLTPPWLS